MMKKLTHPCIVDLRHAFYTTGDKPDAAENARMTAVELLDGRQYLVVLGDACCHVLDLLSRHWNGYQWPLFGSAHFATMNISGRPHVVSINNSYEAFWVIDAEKLVSGDSTAWALAKVRDGVPFSHPVVGMVGVGDRDGDAVVEWRKWSGRCSAP